MSELSAAALVSQLNQLDENACLEAKKGGGIDKSFMESVCAFANEPGLGGGIILLGVVRDPSSLLPYYDVEGVSDPDRLSQDIATQCATVFNVPIRPRVRVEAVNDKPVLIVEIAELAHAEKPLFFRKQGLPTGAFRRIGSTDHHCTEDDLILFYGSRESTTYDDHFVSDATMADIDPEAIDHYRRLREKANPAAEELAWSNSELLQALSAARRDAKGDLRPTLTGILLFGSRIAQRRLLPMTRVDYIRVPGREWVPDPSERFTTTDMRGPLLQLVQRAQAAVVEDLPKAFALEDGEVQAGPGRVNTRVFREAIVNALMHRNYRVHSPVQIIRYSNRIEIINPGYSIVEEDHLGEPGSRTRNPRLAAVFHETNLAETKGSGIRTMRRLMAEAGFAPPTFESDRVRDRFTARFLLHHFLSPSDLRWLATIPHELNEPQKQALIFAREMGAVDNSTYRQFAGVDTLRASQDLRRLRDLSLLEKKGQSTATYYVPGAALPARPGGDDASAAQDATIPDKPLSGMVPSLIRDALSPSLRQRLAAFGPRASKDEVEDLLVAICRERPCTMEELSALLSRRSTSNLQYQYVTPLVASGRLLYLYPDMPRHPRQAYRTPETQPE